MIDPYERLEELRRYYLMELELAQYIDAKEKIYYLSLLIPEGDDSTE